ncbi:hypothetical protein AAEX28_14125 [Lentisphaerota bacterium WC36G]|nr:hypothetical protein LJT99_00875 [Lentisphaerae bacterium WC36]
MIIICPYCSSVCETDTAITKIICNECGKEFINNQQKKDTKQKTPPKKALVIEDDASVQSILNSKKKNDKKEKLQNNNRANFNTNKYKKTNLLNKFNILNPKRPVLEILFKFISLCALITIIAVAIFYFYKIINISLYHKKIYGNQIYQQQTYIDEDRYDDYNQDLSRNSIIKNNLLDMSLIMRDSFLVFILSLGLAQYFKYIRINSENSTKIIRQNNQIIEILSNKNKK